MALPGDGNELARLDDHFLSPGKTGALDAVGWSYFWSRHFTADSAETTCISFRASRHVGHMLNPDAEREQIPVRGKRNLVSEVGAAGARLRRAWHESRLGAPARCGGGLAIYANHGGRSR